MKHIKKNVIFGICLVIFFVSVFFEDKIPFFNETLLGIWMMITVYFELIKNPKVSDKQIYLTTQNDHSFAHGRLILGLFILVGGFLFYNVTGKLNLLFYLLMIQAGLSIFLNFYKKSESKGLSIEASNGLLEYHMSVISKKIALSEITKVSIAPDEIVIYRNQERKNYISFLELNISEVRIAKQFFAQLIHQQVIVSAH